MQTLCITPGDPTGIGPEITAKVLSDWAFEQFFAPCRLIIAGNISCLKASAHRLGMDLPPSSDHIRYIALENADTANKPGQLAYAALVKAVELIAQGEADALVTGPISKENLRIAGLPYEGHTEILQQLAERYVHQHPSYCKLTHPLADIPPQADMLFVYGAFRMLLLTRHVALKDVSQMLTIEGVTQTLRNGIRFLQEKMGIETPRVCLLGVNPHAGEIGGHEEQSVLIPAMETVSQHYDVPIDPPRPADAAFRNFNVHAPPYDLYVAAYHDQGLIPVKLLAGFSAVNVTIGLPFIRTSVSHGMASDIVGKGIASPSSLKEAIFIAHQLVSPQAPMVSSRN